MLRVPSCQADIKVGIRKTTYTLKNAEFFNCFNQLTLIIEA